MEKACEVLGADRFDESLLREQIREIVVPAKNEMLFHFKDGTKANVEWYHRSRRESWTPEMKESARKRTLAHYEAKRKDKENENGS